MPRTTLFFILVTLTLIVTACGSEVQDLNVPPLEEPAEKPEAIETELPKDVQDQGTGTDEDATSADAPRDETSTELSGQLKGVIWTLTELYGQAPLADTYITGTFSEDGTFAGSAGCNSYSTSVEIDANQIHFGLSATTQKMCFEEVMDQEIAYLNALDVANTFEVSEGRLVFFDSEFQAIAIFRAVSQELAGSSWEVISYNNGRGGVVSLLTGTALTIIFNEEGQFNGNAGCNSYFGSYQLEDESLIMGPFGATMKACLEPEGIMDQEAQFLAALESVATYKIDGLSMTMLNADGATAVNFMRVIPSDEGTG